MYLRVLCGLDILKRMLGVTLQLPLLGLIRLTLRMLWVATKLGLGLSRRGGILLLGAGLGFRRRGLTARVLCGHFAKMVISPPFFGRRLEYVNGW